MSNSIAPGSSADVNVKVTALTTNSNVPAQYKTIILKKNLVNGVNTLTQEMMSATNTKYVIKYDYILSENITVPENCILEFDGGSINGNSNSITYQNTKILGSFKATNFVASGTLDHEVLNILYYGAVDINDRGDDDSYQAIQNAIYAGQKQRKEVYIPKGYFKVTQTLTLDPNEMQVLILKGSGRRFSTLASFIGGNSQPLILLTHNVSENKNTVQNTQISDMTLINAGDTSSVGISINRASGTIISNLDIRAFRQGINAILSWCFTIEKCSFFDFAYGWNTCGIYLNRQCNAIVIRECSISLSTTPDRTCVQILDDSSNITFSKCNFEYGNGININGTYPTNAPLTNVTFEECYFEWMTGSCLYIATNIANRVKDILLLNCYFNAIEDGTNNDAIILGVSDNVSIINCEFTRFTNSCIKNNNDCNNLLIVNCSRDENLTLLLGKYYTHTIIDKGMLIAKMVNYTADLHTFASYLSTENKGLMVFDGQTNKPVWYDGNGGWIDVTGVIAGTPISGTFANKPTISANSIPIGFKYFCTDKQTAEGATDGIEIIHKGNDVWVDALGRVVS